MSVGGEGDRPLPLAIAAARHGLPGAAPRPVECPESWPSAVGGLEAQRLVGLARALVTAEGLPIDADGAAALAAAHQRLVGRDLLLERELLAAVDEWGIDPRSARVLKGVAIAHLDEAQPALRSFSDVDLLLPGELVERVVARAQATGSRRSYPEPRPGFDRRFGKGVNLVRPSGRAIDLHRSLAQGPFGVAVRTDDLLAGSQPFGLAGSEVHALDPTCRWLHACYHAALGSAVAPLVSLRDVALTLPRSRRGVEDALALAHRWKGTAVVREAVQVAAERLVLDPSAHPLFRWAAAAPDGPRARRWLSVYRAERSTPLLALYALEPLPRRHRAAYAAAVLAPRRVRTGDDPVRRWRRGWQAATRLTAR